MGRNGSGKSTLLESLAGLNPYGGSILLGEKELSSLSKKEKARQISLIPQKSQVQLKITVEEFVLMGRFPYLEGLRDYSAEDKSHCERWMEFAGLLDFRKRWIGSLSGGEFQKAVIARGLSQGTPCLLLDEPCQGLDPPNREMVYELLFRLAAEGKTLVCASHDREPVLDLRSRILGMKAGENVLELQGGADSWDILREKLFS